MRPSCHAVRRFPLILLVCAAAGGCGGDEHLPPPQLASCSAGWQPLTSPRPILAPGSLVLHGGELIYDAESVAQPGLQQIEAQPVAGGPPRVIADGTIISRLWIEGDQVLFANNATSLSQVPVAGGTPTVLASDANPPAGAPPLEAFSHALSPTELVWWQWGARADAPSEVWARPRTGGAPRLVATLDGSFFFSQMELAGSAVIVADPGATARFVPLDGSAVVPLASAGYRLTGVEAEGVYSFNPKLPFDPSYERYELALSPADGGAARPFWPEMPPRMAPDHLWADGEGGWLVSAIEVFDDGVIHRSVFLIDAGGRATRAACDPSTTAEDYATVRPAFAADAAYLVYEELSDVHHVTWRIVKIPRPLGP